MPGAPLYDPPVETAISRRMWRVYEPVHAVVYFAPEKKERYDSIGLKGGWMGYFAGRAAAMGPAPAEVVIATFYNFNPDMVRRAIPDAWGYASPEQILAARYAIADSALRRLWDGQVASPEVRRAAELARAAAEECSMDGRPLFAAHAGLEWPGEPHLALWHACTLLREFRGDGHVVALAAHKIDGLEAHVLIAAAGVSSGDMLREFRRWSADDWGAAEERLRARGLLDDEGSLTDAGRALRDRIESLTDDLALEPWAALGTAATEELAGLLKPLGRRIDDGSGIDYPNPIGLLRS